MKHLIRSRKDRIIAGVCGGFAEYFNVDPTIARLVWIFFTLFGGSGILAYFLAMIIIPDENKDTFFNQDFFANLNHDKTILWGALLLLVGVILFFQHHPVFNLIWSRFWDSGINLLLVIAIFGFGIYFIYRKRYVLTSLVDDGTGLVLHLSVLDRKLAGVCGGIAESLKIDSILIRFIWVYGTFISAGLGMLLYLVLALVLPVEKLEETDRI